MASFIETIPSIVVSVVVTFLFLWVFYPAWAVLVAEQLEWDVEELSSSPDTADTHPCDESLPPLLSLVIPSYNEEDRIPIMIRESFGYLTSQRGKQLLRELQSCCGDRKTTSSVECDEKSNSSSSSTLEPKIEWIIVNDGSTDSTCDIVRATYQELMANKKGDNGDGGESASSTSCPTSSSAHANWKWKIVSLRENAGKGGAVKTGMNVAKGNFHLMVDADGATDFGSGLESLTRELKTHTQKVIVAASRNENNCDGTSSKAKAMTNSMVAVFGSRAHLEKDSTAQRSFVRTLLMKSFHFFCESICLDQGSRYAMWFQAFHEVSEQYDLPDSAFAAVGIRHGDHFVVRQTAHRYDRGWSELERDRWIQTQYLETSSGNGIHFHVKRHDLCAVLLHAWHMEGK
uniref:Glycosyltransferase 2-like domain-containing protein n=1 Tax=Pseudo-nitzschia australis TaxID=44445 RepID=A0A7S4EMG4_9STRA|mmetsp:Transcript_27760/g.59781  ORF Transcript_27760/g.59781 Transcript_27760/m.59781 type:complete len:402 (+) Transcript_27760:53-1258(+)